MMEPLTTDMALRLSACHPEAPAMHELQRGHLDTPWIIIYVRLRPFPFCCDIAFARDVSQL